MIDDRQQCSVHLSSIAYQLSSAPQGRSLNRLYRSVCFVLSGTGRPSMNRYVVFVLASRMSPSVTTRLATLPTSIEPNLSATPMICAGYSVTDLSASAFGNRSEERRVGKECRSR